MNTFLSHAGGDKRFARKLRADLQRLGHDVWMDERDINAGMSIVQRIQEGLDVVDQLILIVSTSSMKSRWVREEWQSAMTLFVDSTRPRIIPVLREHVKLPPFLKSRLYADFTKSYALGLAKIAVSLSGPQSFEDVPQYYATESELCRRVSFDVLLEEQHQEVVYCGFAHAASLFCYDDVRIAMWISLSKSFEVFLARQEHGDEKERREKMRFYKRKFSYHQLASVVHRCENIAKILSKKDRKKFKVRMLDVPRVNLLNVRLIDNQYFLRLIGFGQMGSTSPVFQASSGSELGEFLGVYLENLRSNKEFWEEMRWAD